jgi:DNA-binding NarL/FixJ family response regulator
MLKVLLADDHDLMRRGIRDLLESDPEIQVCGEASNGREALELARRLKPDVAVLDLTMPEFNGLEAIRQIRSELPKIEVVVFSMHDSEELIREVFAAGARGYVLKSDASLHLAEAVKSVSDHKPFFTFRISEAILNSLLAVGGGQVDAMASDQLTSREREILKLLAENKSNKEIANKLGISVRTVETHRRSIMHKLKATSIVELVHYAIRSGLVESLSPADLLDDTRNFVE